MFLASRRKVHRCWWEQLGTEHPERELKAGQAAANFWAMVILNMLEEWPELRGLPLWVSLLARGPPEGLL